MEKPEAPARPDLVEAAPSSTDGLVDRFVGELPPHPRTPARRTHAKEDIGTILVVYRQILSDSRVQSALEQRLNAAISKEWNVLPGGERRVDRRAAEDLSEQLRELHFDRICYQLLHSVWFGLAVGEVMWRIGTGRVEIEDIRVRSPERFNFAPDGSLLLRTEAKPTGEEIPAAKFIPVARPGDHDDLPFAPGLARWCYWPVWFKRNGFTYWSRALEKFGTPTLHGKHPEGTDNTERERILKMLAAVANSAAIATPENVDIELLESARRTGGDFREFVEAMDRMITTTLLGQSSTTDQGPWRGTAEVQKDVRDEVVAADCRLLSGALNDTLVRWLTDWNFPGAAYPRIVRDVDPPEDLTARAAREEVIARTTGLRPSRSHVEQVYGGDWEDAPGPAADPQTAERQMAALLRFAGASPGDAIAAAAAQAAEGWGPLMESLIEPVLSAVRLAAEEGSSLEEFQERMGEIYAGMDGTPLAKAIRNRSFAARLSGIVGRREGAGAPPDGEASGE